MKWLVRDLITGPCLALVLSEKDYHRAMADFKVPMDQRDPWTPARPTKTSLSRQAKSPLIPRSQRAFSLAPPAQGTRQCLARVRSRMASSLAAYCWALRKGAPLSLEPALMPFLANQPWFISST